MPRPHFRLKIDLSKFFRDVRQSCWIFIDGTKTQYIAQIQQHISKLFGIVEPFHLMLNDTEYLPPTEDSRILKDNETILVIPGSGINNDTNLDASSIACDSNVYNSLAKASATCNGTASYKAVDTKSSVAATVETKTRNISDTSNSLNGYSNDMQSNLTTNTVDMTFHTVIEETDQETDSKGTDSMLADERNVTTAAACAAKRKRVRKRKVKNKGQSVTLPVQSDDIRSKKPKIVDSVIISSGKHIRFNSTEEYENNIAKQIAKEASKEESFPNKVYSSKDLSTLLALRQSSTPLTFMKKKMKNEITFDDVSNEEKKNIGRSNSSLQGDLCINEEEDEKDATTKETKYYKGMLEKDLEKVPVMTRTPQVKDIVAFKTLKLATDYTPQMSNFIVGEVLNYSSQSANYTLRILDGATEIQVPLGKFSLSEDDSACDYDTVTFNYAQIREPRLVS